MKSKERKKRLWKFRDTNHVDGENEKRKRERERNVIHHVTCRMEMKEFSVKLNRQKQF